VSRWERFGADVAEAAGVGVAAGAATIFKLTIISITGMAITTLIISRAATV
jgi:hypothetical protein